MAAKRDRSDSTPVLQTIYEELGFKYINDSYNVALKAARNTTPNIGSVEELRPIYEIITRYPAGVVDQSKLPTIEKVYEFYKNSIANNMKKWGHCKAHVGQSQNGYPCQSCGTSRNPSTKLQFHQVPHFLRSSNASSTPPSSAYIPNGYAASHLCHNKMCMVCPIKETTKENKARDHCRPLCIVNNEVVWVCLCTPQCKDISQHAYF